MEINGKFTMRICDSHLDFSKIEQNLEIIPTKIIKKGQLLGKLNNREAPYDVWSYERKITNEDVFAELIKLLNDLLPYSNYIREIKNVYEVTLNCYLGSDYAQIGLEITDEMIALIGKFGVGISFHILSFGGVEDE